MPFITLYPLHFGGNGAIARFFFHIISHHTIWRLYFLRSTGKAWCLLAQFVRFHVIRLRSLTVMDGGSCKRLEEK